MTILRLQESETIDLSKYPALQERAWKYEAQFNEIPGKATNHPGPRSTHVEFKSVLKCLPLLFFSGVAFGVGIMLAL